MGKAHNKRLSFVQQQQSDVSTASTTTFLCRRCCLILFTPKCAIVLLIGVAAFLSAVFSILPIRYRHAGFDAKDSIKLAATVQAYFELHKPVSEFIPYITRLEYDINGEIGVPYFIVHFMLYVPFAFSINQERRVALKSLIFLRLLFFPYTRPMCRNSDPTNVVFGFLFYSIDNAMYPVSLSVLKSSLVDLFLQTIQLEIDLFDFWIYIFI